MNTNSFSASPPPPKKMKSQGFIVFIMPEAYSVLLNLVNRNMIRATSF